MGLSSGGGFDAIGDDGVVTGATARGLSGRPRAGGGAGGAGRAGRVPRRAAPVDEGGRRGVLPRAGLGTLLFDLLTPAEEFDRADVFDIGLLARRLVEVAVWLTDQDHARELPVGYFGASAGAAAALCAAADPRVRVSAVVLDLNRQAAKSMSCETALAEVAGATHLFEEPGTLRKAAEPARDWFTTRRSAVVATERMGPA